MSLASLSIAYTSAFTCIASGLPSRPDISKGRIHYGHSFRVRLGYLKHCAMSIYYFFKHSLVMKHSGKNEIPHFFSRPCPYTTFRGKPIRNPVFGPCPYTTCRRKHLNSGVWSLSLYYFSTFLCAKCQTSEMSLSKCLFICLLFIMSYLPRSTPSVRSTVLPGAPALHA